METIQLSHDELLFLLGHLRLPTPLALGDEPALGLSAAGLQLAMATAAGSLAARDLLFQPAHPAAPPEIAPDLADLVRAVADADRCLVLARIGASERGAEHITLNAGQAVLHSSPQIRVHRFERLPAEAIVGCVLARCATDDGLATADRSPVACRPPSPATAGAQAAARPLPPGGFTAPAAALSAALDALTHGAPSTAQALLRDVAVPAEHAAAFIRLLGAGCTRHALAAIRDLRGSPESRSALLITGADTLWQGIVSPADPDLVTVQPITPAALTAQATELIGWLRA